MELDLRHVRMLIVVAEELNFTRAAARLGMAQPALSQQVGRIERTLGVRVFERTTRAVTLTDAGRRLLPLASEVDVSMRRLRDAAGPDVTTTRALRVGMRPPTAGLPVDELRRRHPEVSVRQSILTEDAAIVALNGGELDVMQALESPNRPFDFVPNIRVATLVQEPLWVALPLAHPLAARSRIGLADLAHDVWVEYPEGTFAHDFLCWLCAEAGFAPDVRYLTNDHLMMLALFRQGCCVALASPITPIPENCCLRPLDTGISRRFVLAWRDGCSDEVAHTLMTHMRRLYRDQARATPSYWDEIVADTHRYRHLHPLDG
jgi:DNA-binding transcriptional LysR family regulator